MVISRSLLLKCLGGVAACFGTASLGFLGSETFGFGNVSSESGLKLNELLEKVGLSECTVSGSKECSIVSGNLKVQHDSTKEEGKTKQDSSSGKIKVYSDTDYNKGFKFLIEDGDINLGESSSSISKLEEFETYEIKQDETDNSKWYFSRKKTSAKNISESLGLPNTCTLGASVNCSEKEITTSEITSMKFDGVSGTPSSSGTVKLTVTKETTDTAKYPLGYKFTFKAKESTVTLTLGDKTVKLETNEDTEFKIKKSGSSLSLEESGSLNMYLKNVGLSGCTTSTNNSECSIVSGSLKVQQGSTKEEGKSKQDGSSGKIKVYKENSTDNYFKGYRFEIEEGNITLTGGAGTISELKQYETYEIKEESGNWYFSRKKTAAENIKDKLGLPSECNIDSSCSNIEVDTSAIASMKFDGVTGTPSSTGAIILTVSKETSNTFDYPLGYKFELKGKDNSVTLTLEGNNNITLQQNTATEFRIKKGTTGNSLTLEEAWSLENLLKKVSLSACTTTNGTGCTIGSSFNVEQGSNKETNKTQQSGSSGTPGKIKVYKENSSTTYNKGFKFVIEDGDINLGGSSSSISKLEEFETYEIKQDETDNSKWYFSRKKTSAENIRETLGLPSECNIDSSCSEKELTTTDISKIKFDGVSGNPSSTGTIKLTVTKESSNTAKYPLGYKFTFKAKDSSVTLTLGSKSVQLETNEDTEFRIKKSGSSLTLEESGSLSIYLKNVGLSGCTTSNSTECSIVSGSLKVQQGSTKEEGKSKGSGTGTPGKIKVYKESSNTDYSKGYRFEIEEGDITLTGSSSTISKLEQYETYEIKEESGNWYFSRKKTAAENIKDKLGLPSDCTLGDTPNCSEKEIDTSAIASMKFDGVSGNPSSTGAIKLTVTKLTTTDPDYPLDYKFELKSKENSATLTLGNNTITLQQNEAREFKIKKGTSGNTLTLEKAWTAKTLGAKVGLDCPEQTTENSDKKCTFTDGSINVKNDDTKITNGKLDDGSSSKKMSYQEDQEGYNQGFKFYLEESEDITLTNSTGGSDDAAGNKKIHKKGDNGTETYYEIKKDDSDNKWYLTKKANAQQVT